MEADESVCLHWNTDRVRRRQRTGGGGGGGVDLGLLWRIVHELHYKEGAVVSTNQHGEPDKPTGRTGLSDVTS